MFPEVCNPANLAFFQAHPHVLAEGKWLPLYCCNGFEVTDAEFIHPSCDVQAYIIYQPALAALWARCLAAAPQPLHALVYEWHNNNLFHLSLDPTRYGQGGKPDNLFMRAMQYVDVDEVVLNTSRLDKLNLLLHD